MATRDRASQSRASDCGGPDLGRTSLTESQLHPATAELLRAVALLGSLMTDGGRRHGTEIDVQLSRAGQALRDLTDKREEWVGDRRQVDEVRRHIHALGKLTGKLLGPAVIEPDPVISPRLALQHFLLIYQAGRSIEPDRARLFGRSAGESALQYIKDAYPEDGQRTQVAVALIFHGRCRQLHLDENARADLTGPVEQMLKEALPRVSHLLGIR